MSRTVETHVSSLLRKLGVPDRRGLAQLAAGLAEAERSGAAVARLPSPLTPFIGRMRESAALITDPAMVGAAVAAALGSVSSRAAGWTSRSWPPWRIAMPCWCWTTASTCARG